MQNKTILFLLTMCRISKKYKIMLIVALGILLGVILLFLRPTVLWLNLSKISYGTFPFDKNKAILFLNDSLLWDTGTFGSSISEKYKENIPNKIRFLNSTIIDFFNEKQQVPFYYSRQFNVGNSFSICNFFFFLLDDREHIEKYQIGCIGMDVIGKANWVIDFDLEKIHILPQNKTYETTIPPQLIFEYKQNKEPKTQLDFSGFQIENVLIDAGYNSEIVLLKSDIEEINKKHKPVDTLTAATYGIHSTEPVISNAYIYDTIMINNICFKNVQIVEGNKRLIGFAFFKRFNKVFLNTKEKDFYFY